MANGNTSSSGQARVALIIGAYTTMIAVVAAVVVMGIKSWTMAGETIAMLTVVVTGCVAVLKDFAAFEFGSSRSSREKDETIKELSKGPTQ